MTDQILSVVGAYCPPSIVSGLVKDLKRTEAMERKMSAWPKPRGQKNELLNDPGKLERLITLCHVNLRPPVACQVLIEIGDVLRMHGENGLAEELYGQAVAKGEEAGVPVVVAQAYMRRGDLYSRRGKWKMSSTDLARSKSILAGLRRNDLLGRVENILGTNYAEQGKLKRAIPLFKNALVLFERSREVHLTGMVLMNLGIVQNIIGNYDSALANYKRAQSCYEGVGDMGRLAELHHNMGMTYLSMELYSAAIREFDAGYLLSSKLQNISLMGLANLGKANAYFRRNDLPMALKLVSQAMDAFGKSSDRLSLADAYKMKGMIHREMKSYEAAESYFQTSIRINTELSNQLNLAETLFEMGLLEVKRNRKKDAVTLFQRSKAVFGKVGAREEWKKADDIMNSIKGKSR